jgi:inhibitor of KinA
MVAVWPRFLPSGDAALTVELGEGVSREVNAQVVRLHRALRAARPLGVCESVPAFRSLLVQYDPLQTGPEELRQVIAGLLAGMNDAPAIAREWLLPACYAPEMALDLAEVAARSGVSVAQAVECHASATYYVYMLGFLPGFPYLGDLPEPLRLPRRHDPRTRVPSGSVAIANEFTGIYPQESPGGWHVIGRAAAKLFDPIASQPALFAPGDLVRFRPVSLAEFEALAREPCGGARVIAEAA